MDEIGIVAALAALAQTTRLEAFRHLVAAEPEGLAAGKLADTLCVPQNTLSTHLNVLAHAGLVNGSRHGRSIIYRANIKRLQEMMLFLIKDCCGGRPELCAPLIAELTPCCAKERELHD